MLIIRTVRKLLLRLFTMPSNKKFYLFRSYSRMALSLAVSLTLLTTASAVDNDTIKSLKAIGGKVVRVVDQNRDACVALVDGMGSGSGVIVSEDGLEIGRASCRERV